MPCIVCGKKRHLTKVIFPHGKFEVCCGGACRKHVVRKVQGYYSIAGFSFNEFIDAEFFSQKELDAMKLTREDELDLADNFVVEHFWNDDYVSSSIREAIQYAAEAAEKMSLRRMPREQLPLKIGDLKFDDNIPILEQLLKGEVPRP